MKDFEKNHLTEIKPAEISSNRSEIKNITEEFRKKIEKITQQKKTESFDEQILDLYNSLNKKFSHIFNKIRKSNGEISSHEIKIKKNYVVEKILRDDPQGNISRLYKTQGKYMDVILLENKKTGKIFSLDSLLPPNTDFQKTYDTFVFYFKQKSFPAQKLHDHPYEISFPVLKKNQSSMLFLFSLLHEIGHSINWQTPRKYSLNTAFSKQAKMIIQDFFPSLSPDDVKEVYKKVNKTFQDISQIDLETLFSSQKNRKMNSSEVEKEIEKALTKRFQEKFLDIFQNDLPPQKKNAKRIISAFSSDLLALSESQDENFSPQSFHLHSENYKKYVLQIFQRQISDERDAWAKAFRLLKQLQKNIGLEYSISEEDLLEYAKFCLYSYEMSFRFFLYKKTRDNFWLLDHNIGRTFLKMKTF